MVYTWHWTMMFNYSLFCSATKWRQEVMLNSFLQCPKHNSEPCRSSQWCSSHHSIGMHGGARAHSSLLATLILLYANIMESTITRSIRICWIHVILYFDISMLSVMMQHQHHYRQRGCDTICRINIHLLNRAWLNLIPQNTFLSMNTFLSALS